MARTITIQKVQQFLSDYVNLKCTFLCLLRNKYLFFINIFCLKPQIFLLLFPTLFNITSLSFAHPHLARWRRLLWDLHCGWPAGPPRWRSPACRTLAEPSGNPRSWQSDNIRPQDATCHSLVCQYKTIFFCGEDSSLRHCCHASTVQTLQSLHLLLTSRCVHFVSRFTTTITFHSACNQCATLSGCFSNDRPCLSFFFPFYQERDCSTPWLDVGGSNPAEIDDTLRPALPDWSLMTESILGFFCTRQQKREQTCREPSVGEVPCLKVRCSPCFDSRVLSHTLIIVCGFLITASGSDDSESPHRSQRAT